jgi:hypothetical protein
MRGLIPSTILIFGLGSRLFLGEGTAGIRQIVDRVVIVHMARDDADRSCGADGLCIARTVRPELARWQVTQRRQLSLRQHDRLSHRERRVTTRSSISSGTARLSRVRQAADGCIPTAAATRTADPGV